MQTLTVVSILWVVSVAAFIALMAYRAHLTNNETDELFLDSEGDSTRKTEHDVLVNRVHRIQPYCKGAGGAAVLMTVAIVGIEAAHVVAMIQ